MWILGVFSNIFSQFNKCSLRVYLIHKHSVKHVSIRTAQAARGRKSYSDWIKHRNLSHVMRNSGVPPGAAD